MKLICKKLNLKKNLECNEPFYRNKKKSIQVPYRYRLQLTSCCKEAEALRDKRFRDGIKR